MRLKIEDFVLSPVGTVLMFLGAILDLAIVAWVLFSTQNFKFNTPFGYVHIVLGLLILAAVQITKDDGKLTTATSEYAGDLWRDSIMVAMILGIVEVTLILYYGHPAPWPVKIIAGALVGIPLFWPASAFAFSLRIIANRN